MNSGRSHFYYGDFAFFSLDRWEVSLSGEKGRGKICRFWEKRTGFPHSNREGEVLPG